VRLVGVDDPFIALQAFGKGQARMARREEHVRKDADFVQLESAVHRADGSDAAVAKAVLPARTLAHFGDVLEEVVDGRVVAVEEGLDEGH
jgi:hypothetical protein